jgi:hypothetical protein
MIGAWVLNNQQHNSAETGTRLVYPWRLAKSISCQSRWLPRNAGDLSPQRPLGPRFVKQIEVSNDIAGASRHAYPKQMPPRSYIQASIPGNMVSLKTFPIKNSSKNPSLMTGPPEESSRPGKSHSVTNCSGMKLSISFAAVLPPAVQK